MNGRVLRIELRRSAAPWAALLTLLVGLAFLLLLTGPWVHGSVAWTRQWTSDAWWERHLMSFLWPLAVGAGALHGLRDRRSGTLELLATTPRPARHRAGVSAGATALGLVLAYLALFAVGAVQVVAGGGWTHAGWVPILAVGALALPAGAVLGIGVGRALPSPLTPPALVVATLVGCVLAATSAEPASNGSGVLPHRVALLFPSLPQLRSVFETVAGRASAGQAVWLTGLAVTGLWLAAATARRARLLALAPAALAAAVALPLLPSDASRTYVEDASAVEPVCQGQVCVSRVQEKQLDTLAGPSREALRLLAAKLPDLPGRPDKVREYTKTWPPVTAAERKPDRLQLGYDDRSFDGVKGKELTRSLLAGAGTPPCPDDPDGGEGAWTRDVAARTATAAWFLGEVKPLPGSLRIDAKALPAARDTLRELRALPETEQRERITAFRSASRSCEGDLLNTLRGGGER